MTVPGFSAQATLRRHSYGLTLPSETNLDRVILQDCGFWKGAACWTVISTCGGTAGFVDRNTFINCVDRLSNGYCVECVTGGTDPRNPPPGSTSLHCAWM